MSRGRTPDYCGYCGQDFTRRTSDPQGVCTACLNDPDPQVRASIQADLEYAQADEANDRDLAQRARRGK